LVKTAAGFSSRPPQAAIKTRTNNPNNLVMRDMLVELTTAKNQATKLAIIIIFDVSKARRKHNKCIKNKCESF
jgi:hypothetical protein